ncbi:hypothetical protein DFH06DRAFT_1289492 [Mycena polygramma]|nr:hypothetical protein DFH06DRAFT_1289492 [Mycena polygramma]
MASNPFDIQELVECCVDFLDDSSLDLKACTLVCRAWTYTAQSHLFSTNAFWDSMADQHLRIPKLIDMASTFHILGLISRLEINLHYLGSDSFLVAIDSLTRLKEVRISGNPVASTPGTAMLSVRGLFRLPTVQNVEVHCSFTSPVAFLEIWDGCSESIRHLALGSFRVNDNEYDWNSAPVVEPRQKIKLESLRLSYADLIFPWLACDACPFAFSRVATLSVAHAGIGFRTTPVIFWKHSKIFSHLCSPTAIQHLELRGDAILDPIDLGMFTHLQNLTLELVNVRTMNMILTTLARIPSGNRISRIAIHCTRTWPHILSSEDAFYPLDDLLSRMPMPELINVEVLVESRYAEKAKNALAELDARICIRWDPARRPHLLRSAQKQNYLSSVVTRILGLEGHCMRMADRVWFFLNFFFSPCSPSPELRSARVRRVKTAVLAAVQEMIFLRHCFLLTLARASLGSSSPGKGKFPTPLNNVIAAKNTYSGAKAVHNRVKNKFLNSEPVDYNVDKHGSDTFLTNIKATKLEALSASHNSLADRLYQYPMSVSSFGPGGLGVGPLSSRQPEYQNQYTLVNVEGRLRFAAVLRHTLGLPPEILAEIFLHCLPESIVPSLTTAPLILCGVCRRWRDVAITTPALWKSLIIDFDQMSTKGVYRRGMVGMYQMWLSRAQASPLSLGLHAEGRFAPGPMIQPLLSTITGLSGQWRSIDLYLGEDLANFIFPTAEAFPLLEELRLSNFDHDLSTISLCDAPKLCSFSFYYDPPNQLPWHQLTTLWCGFVSLSACLQILRDASNLLNGNFQVEDDPSTLPISIVQHSHLQNLELGAADQDEDRLFYNPMPLLKCFTIPSLKSLTLDFPWSRGVTIPPADTSPFLSFMSRSSCQLHTLSLSDMPTTSDNLVECLKATPSLVHLKLTPVPISADMDAVFAQCTGSVDFLPKLESFDTYFSSTPDLPRAYVLVQMLSWRWAAGTVGIGRLRSFRLGHDCDGFGFDSTGRVFDEDTQLYRRNIGLEFDVAVKSHPEWHRLQTEGMKLSLGPEGEIRAEPDGPGEVDRVDRNREKNENPLL